MTAEVEVRRLRAEIGEIRSNRDELSATVRRLQAEVVANANALAEKAQLVSGQRQPTFPITFGNLALLRLNDWKLWQLYNAKTLCIDARMRSYTKSQRSSQSR